MMSNWKFIYLFSILTRFVLLYQARCNHCPTNFIMINIAKRPSTNKPTLNILMSCVLGSTSLHTKAQRVAISDIRKIKDKMFLNIYIYYTPN